MRSTCNELGCDKPAMGRGFCNADYQRRRYHGTLPTEKPTKACQHCGTLFQSWRADAMYCGSKCKDATAGQRRRLPTRQGSCERCGEAITLKYSNARFCSNTCGQAHRNARIAAARVASKVGRAPCVGCGLPIAPEEVISKVYCSRECKTRSRRHETYGLTWRELDDLLKSNPTCQICGTSDWGPKGPQVDHCHATSVVRGILCLSCNNGLGRFRDNVNSLQAAIEYLSKASERAG